MRAKLKSHQRNPPGAALPNAVATVKTRPRRTSSVSASWRPERLRALCICDDFLPNLDERMPAPTGAVVLVWDPGW